MRRNSIVILSIVLAWPAGGTGCRQSEDGPRVLRERFADLRDLLRSGPPVTVVAGPRDGGVFLEDCSRWAAEEMERVLRREGFGDLIGSAGATPAEPVRDVQVIEHGSLGDPALAAGNQGSRVTVFVGVRSIELRESAPRLLDWAYEGTIVILDPGKDRVIEWQVTGSERTEAPNDVPEDPVAARRPLSKKWARGAFRKGSLGLGIVPGE
jgi:hypothetical protein